MKAVSLLLILALAGTAIAGSSLLLNPQHDLWDRYCQHPLIRSDHPYICLQSDDGYLKDSAVKSGNIDYELGPSKFGTYLY